MASAELLRRCLQLRVPAAPRLSFDKSVPTHDITANSRTVQLIMLPVDTRGCKVQRRRRCPHGLALPPLTAACQADLPAVLGLAAGSAEAAQPAPKNSYIATKEGYNMEASRRGGPGGGGIGRTERAPEARPYVYATAAQGLPDSRVVTPVLNVLCLKLVFVHPSSHRAGHQEAGHLPQAQGQDPGQGARRRRQAVSGGARVGPERSAPLSSPWRCPLEPPRSPPALRASVCLPPRSPLPSPPALKTALSPHRGENFVLPIFRLLLLCAPPL